MIRIHILGTSSHYPWKSRNHPGIFIDMYGRGILLDCGEGIQRQMRIAGISITKIDYILITHWHGDHMLGIGGILYSLESMGYRRDLNIILPEENFEDLKKIIDGLRINTSFKINLIGSREGKIIDEPFFEIHGFELKHTVKNFGFFIKEKDRYNILEDKIRELNIRDKRLLGSLKRNKQIRLEDGRIIRLEDVSILRKGIKISYITDTLFFEDIIEKVKDSDILIAESSYFFQPDIANEHYHLDFIHTREIFRKSNSKILLITHFSQRYEKEIDLIERDVSNPDENIYLLHDFDYIEIEKDKIKLKIKGKEFLYRRDISTGEIKRLY